MLMSLSQKTGLRRASGVPWYMSQKRGFWSSFLLCSSRVAGSSTAQSPHSTSSPHSSTQYTLKKGKQRGYHLRKETAKMLTVYGLCRWLIPQHNLIPKQLQQKQNPHTNERQSTKSGPLLSTCLYKADITTEITLLLSYRAQLPIYLKLLYGKLKVKKTENRAAGVQMWVLAHWIWYSSLIQNGNYHSFPPLQFEINDWLTKANRLSY